jgi:hypothetical protein
MGIVRIVVNSNKKLGIREGYAKLTSSPRRFLFSRRVYQIRRVSDLSITVIELVVQCDTKLISGGEITEASRLLPADISVKEKAVCS